MTIMLNGRARMRFSGSPLEQFAGTLGNQLGKPVWDATGLKGKCDFSVYWTSEGGRIPPLPPPPGVVAPPVASSPDEFGAECLRGDSGAIAAEAGGEEGYGGHGGGGPRREGPAEKLESLAKLVGATKSKPTA